LTVDGNGPRFTNGAWRRNVPIQNPIVGFDELPPATDAPLVKAISNGLKAKKKIAISAILMTVRFAPGKEKK
jgi:hypothetical protein